MFSFIIGVPLFAKRVLYLSLERQLVTAYIDARLIAGQKKAKIFLIKIGILMCSLGSKRVCVSSRNAADK